MVKDKGAISLKPGSFRFLLFSVLLTWPFTGWVSILSGSEETAFVCTLVGLNASSRRSISRVDPLVVVSDSALSKSSGISRGKLRVNFTSESNMSSTTLRTLDPRCGFFDLVSNVYPTSDMA